MQNEFVPYEQTLELKELGIDDHIKHSYGYYDADKKLFISTSLLTNDSITAPLWQQAFDFLREKYKFMYLVEDIMVAASSTVGYRFRYRAWRLMEEDCPIADMTILGFLTYDQAKLNCLKDIIHLVKNEKQS